MRSTFQNQADAIDEQRKPSVSGQPPFEFSNLPSPPPLPLPYHPNSHLPPSLLILKEALNVKHNEIKRGENSLLASASLTFSPHYTNVEEWGSILGERGEEQVKNGQIRKGWEGCGVRAGAKYESVIHPCHSSFSRNRRRREGSPAALRRWWMSSPLPADPGSCTWGQRGAGGRKWSVIRAWMWLGWGPGQKGEESLHGWGLTNC